MTTTALSSSYTDPFSNHYTASSHPSATPGSEVSSFADSLDSPVALENAWSFWHDKFIGPGQTVEEYEASLHRLCIFNTIQDFWKNFNNLPPAEKLKPKSSFHMMKANIRPIWEDSENANGGFWAVRVRKEDTQTAWKELVLAAIGEQFSPVIDADDDICGITVSVRHFDNIVEVWNANSRANTQLILQRARSILPGIDLRNPFYKAHRDHSAFNAEKSKQGPLSPTSPTSAVYAAPISPNSGQRRF